MDAGKTTLTEGLLYVGGAFAEAGPGGPPGRISGYLCAGAGTGHHHFSKQAVLPLDGLELTSLDTPGHADFSAEAERTLQVLDCAILVVSGADGVQGHTLTLWRPLERYGVPAFLFVNKMDQPGTDRRAADGAEKPLGRRLCGFLPPGGGAGRRSPFAARRLWRSIWLPAG